MFLFATAYASFYTVSSVLVMNVAILSGSLLQPSSLAVSGVSDVHTSYSTEHTEQVGAEHREVVRAEHAEAVRVEQREI